MNRISSLCRTPTVERSFPNAINSSTSSMQDHLTALQGLNRWRGDRGVPLLPTYASLVGLHFPERLAAGTQPHAWVCGQELGGTSLRLEWLKRSPTSVPKLETPRKDFNVHVFQMVPNTETTRWCCRRWSVFLKCQPSNMLMLYSVR